MRRKLRRNPEIHARPEPGGQGMGIVLNPKTLEPCFPFKAGGNKKRTVGFYAGKDMVLPMGAGYFDEASGDSYDTSASGYPRAHTPDGVRVMKAGYGTVLYTSLCLGATMRDRRLIALEMDPHAEGISSNQHRSRAADLWWAHALERDLSRQEEIEGEAQMVEQSEDFDFDIGNSSGGGRSEVWDAAKSFVSDRVQGSISDMDINITGTSEWEEEGDNENGGTVDIYDFEQARQFIPYFSAGPHYYPPATNAFEDLVAPGTSRGTPWLQSPPLPEPLWLVIDEDQDMEFDEALLSTMLLTGCGRAVRTFIQQVTQRCGMPTLYEKLLLVSALDGRAGAVIDDVDKPSGDLRPNPHRKASQRAKGVFMSTLSKPERYLLEKRQEIIEETGLVKFRDFDD
jgi:hypothetical protein